MLALHNSSVSNVYTNNIDTIICQFYHLYLEQYYIQQQNDLNFPKFMLELLYLYLNLYIFVGSGKISNNLC